MTLEIAVIENKNIEDVHSSYQQGQAYYDQNDYALVYKTNYYNYNYFELDKNSFQVMQGTLAIVFDVNSKKFNYLDSFTNKEKWNLQDDLKFKKDARGQLQIVKEFDDDDRYTFPEEPQYFYSKNGILKIALTENEGDAIFYEVASNLVVGLRDGRIVSIYLDKINFI
ncbi:hypothetical protein PNK_p0053 (plasmid) [Candidatus Protochlamydia naegleriophila]|uniref:Uncharacterized protein n=1 Tax=Candidatus Protochlamydia naegleriophila TaxID=389348 RepID=A0A0U5K7E1_9BACT|nr:hypothetical protein [Candidatus Protochlamydia naegleriophila]CUI18107.1 hypothetical protein PNK_p0053 [Candidatus Protochlamydia naegleriophila]